MANEQMPAEAPAEAAPQQEGQSDLVQVIGNIQNGLGVIAEAAQKSGALPPEAMEALSAAKSAYDQFVQIVGAGEAQPQEQVSSAQGAAENAAGAPDARPV